MEFHRGRLIDHVHLRVADVAVLPFFLFFPRSMFALTKQLLQLRRTHGAIALGAYRTVYQNERLLAFDRHDGQERYCVVINFSSEAITLFVAGNEWADYVVYPPQSHSSAC